MKTFKLTVTEDELKALINYHHNNYEARFNPETSERIHSLTKRLNRDTPEIEGDPRPQNINNHVEAAKEEQPTSW